MKDVNYDVFLGVFFWMWLSFIWYLFLYGIFFNIDFGNLKLSLLDFFEVFSILVVN